MIKVSTILAMMALLFTCGAGTASAASCAGTSSAMSQLVSATPGGLDALNAITFGGAVPTLVPQSEPNRNLLTYDTSRADFLIRGVAVSAQKSGKLRSARLFIRLLNEGTPEEKLTFINDTGKTYTFPERFYWKSGIVKVKSACRQVAELFCWVACTGLGEHRKCAEEQCKTIIVDACP